MKTMKNLYFNNATRLSFLIHICSVLSYASEILDFHKDDALKKHLEYLKIMFKVKHTLSLMVYNELGRLPLYIQSIVKFWCKLLQYETCIMTSIYQDMFERAEKYLSVKYTGYLM